MITEKQYKELIKNNIIYYGKTLYLLGTAKYGNVYKPVRIKSVAHLYSVFGTEGTLIDNYISIKGLVKGINVYCCKITGHDSKCSININVPGEDVKNNGLCFTTIANEEFNNTKLSIYKDSLIFTFNNSKTFIYNFNEEEPLSSLIERINNDDNNIHCFCTCDNSIKPYNNLFTVNPQNVYFCGGESGITASKDTLYDNLKTAYKILDGELIDVIVPLECYIDDEKDYYNLTMKFLLNQLSNGVVTLSVFGFNKNTCYDINSYIDNVVLKNINKLGIDNYDKYSSLAQIVAGDLMASYNAEINNGYVIYAALLCNVDLNTPVTKFHLDDNVFLIDEFDNEGIQKLSNNGVMCFRESPLYKCVVACSNRTPCKDEYYKFIYNIRCIEFAVCCMHDIINLVIGENINTLMKNNALQTLISTGLDILVENNILKAYNINVIDNKNDITITFRFKTQYMDDFIERKGTLNYGN